jgi:O-succinylbenzoate synthase
MQMIFIWRYSLRSRFALNARASRRDFDGVLLRVGDGFGCLHPWPELGDAPLETQLEALRSGVPTPSGVRALSCAAMDERARREGRWLFEGLEVPESHVIEGSVREEELGRFAAVKMKCGPAIEAEARRVRGLAERVPEAALRLDFNGSLEPQGYARFLDSVPPDVKARIDFIEDPVPYDEAVWPTLPKEVPLAVDRGSAAATEGFAFRVVKPAVQEMRVFTEPVVVTSYMDHPLGQVFAAYEAATYKGLLHGAGLLTHGCFLPEEFGERLTVENARLQPPRGTGLGFDDLLEGLPWTLL